MAAPRENVAAECARGGERVREMAAKVIGRRLVGDGLDAVARRRDDPVPRVRAAVERSVAALSAAGA